MTFTCLSIHPFLQGYWRRSSSKIGRTGVCQFVQLAPMHPLELSREPFAISPARGSTFVKGLSAIQQLMRASTEMNTNADNGLREKARELRRWKV